MPLKVIEAACTWEPDRSRGMVVIESDAGGPPFTDAFQELDGASSVQLAQQYACAMGCAPAYLNGNKIGPYPVNAEGLSLENVRDAQGKPLHQSHERMQPARYRVDVPVSRPIR